MALHIQMSDEALATLKRTARRNNLSSIAACLALIGLGGGILFFTVLFIEGEIASPFTPYTAPIENAPPSKKPKVKEMTTKTSSSSIAPSVIVSSSSSIVSMADVKIATPDISLGMSIELDLGSGLGSGLGEAEGGLGGEEGDGSALEGTFYDFKLVRNGRAKTSVATNKFEVINILSEFFQKNWSQNVLRKYYSAPTKLYASNFIIPSCNALFAPTAFKAVKSEPSALAAIYRGKVRAPKTGKFRFLGLGDDIVAVRFNNKMVLEYGWAIPTEHKDGNPYAAGTLGINKDFIKKVISGESRNHKGYKLRKVGNIGRWNTIFGGLMGGTPFDVVEGKEYPIEILICEIPGGSFGGMLLIEDINTPLIINGVEIYDVFRTNFTLPDAASLTQELRKGKFIAPKNKVVLPVFNPDSMIWAAVP